MGIYDSEGEMVEGDDSEEKGVREDKKECVGVNVFLRLDLSW